MRFAPFRSSESCWTAAALVAVAVLTISASMYYSRAAEPPPIAMRYSERLSAMSAH